MNLTPMQSAALDKVASTLAESQQLIFKSHVIEALRIPAERGDGSVSPSLLRQAMTNAMVQTIGRAAS
jgi:hypothetical protein